jgi:signal transduction histidine kinase
MSKRAANQRIDQAAEGAARFEVAGDLVVALDGDRNVLYLSPGWEPVFGSAVGSLIGHPFSEVFGEPRVRRLLPEPNPPLDPSILIECADTRASAGKQTSRVLEGHAYHVLEDPDDCLIVFREATERWNALVGWVAESTRIPEDANNAGPDGDQELVRSQRLASVGALAGGVAHAFNNFLTPIVGNVSLALLDLPATSPVRKQLEMIRKATNRASALTRQLLAFAGQSATHVNAINVTMAVEEMTLLLDASSSGSTQIDYDLKSGLPFIEVDSQHIGQIVLNLVTNACESFPANSGRVEINTGALDAEQVYLDACLIGRDLAGNPLEKGRYVYLEVCDNGSGVPEQDWSRIFEPGFTTRGRARGLGLTAVAEIIRRYSGALEFISEIDHGTRVRVLFPTAR